MNYAKLFASHPQNSFIRLFSKFYFKFFVRTNAQRIKYLRDAGAKIGKGCTIYSIAMFGSEPYLVEVGDNTFFSGSTSQLLTHDGGIGRLHQMGITPKPLDIFGKIRIGNNCFIGLRTIIMKNVTIGDNCIIGAGSVVTKSIPAGSVAAGVPARVICTVQEYYEKNLPLLDDTVGMAPQAKREYIESHMDVYEARRREREV